jgi:serine/threonine protein kinase
MEYVGSQAHDLRTEDVSRIAYQLLSACDHCFRHRVIHRDIKPEVTSALDCLPKKEGKKEKTSAHAPLIARIRSSPPPSFCKSPQNVMFESPEPGAAIRLIDFGSGTVDGDDPTVHTTFAGSAFYISPEMFQRTYTAKTDVWSCGVTLYVLVAGYPADNLQAAFNMLQTAVRDLHRLPNLPDNLPDSFYELLSRALTYRHKQRPDAGALLQACEFVKFHREFDKHASLSLQDISSAAAAAAAATALANSKSITATSVEIRGSVVRHNLLLGFKQFERAVTALLAAVLATTELAQLLQLLQDRATAASDDEQQKLSVCRVSELKAILKDELKNDQVYVQL